MKGERSGGLGLGIVCLLLLPVLAFAGPTLDLVPSDTAGTLLPPEILPTFPPEPEPDPADLVQAHPTVGAPELLISGLRQDVARQVQAPLRAADSETTADMHAGDSASVGSLNLSTDGIPDVEPSIIAINRNGTNWTTSVYVKHGTQSGNFISQGHFSTTSDFVTVYKGALALAPGFQFSGNFYLAANPFFNGVAPGRIYASGLVYNEPNPLPNGVAVWRSDDGGLSWSSPKLVAVENNPNFSAKLDKPAIGVSWHANSLGYVYVAYTRFPNPRQILIARSTDGGDNFAAPVQIAASIDVNGAQVVVNPSLGHVYVLWTDVLGKAIKMSTSTNLGQNWSAPETVASINPVVGPINGGLTAQTFATARFNPVANRLVVVWHERETNPSSGPTDVYYISKDFTTSPPAWQPAKVRINDVQLNDQFMPALDTDTTGRGNMVVTFYDRRNDPGNILYQLFSARIDPNGNRLEPNQLVSPFQSNPQLAAGGLIGDYQDSWSQSYSGVYYQFPAWVGIPTTTGIGDVYVSAINPVAEFVDVPPSYWAYAHIKAVATRGSMFGCGGGNFCPAAFVDRKMLADFIVVGMHQIQSAVAFNAYFDDIANDAFAPFINRVMELSITSGCATRQFCPHSLINRAQAAVFIVKGMGQPPSAAAFNAYFDDIPNDFFAPYINRMYELGITGGCGFRLYCPNSNIPKDQMAVFLNRAFPT